MNTPQQRGPLGTAAHALRAWFVQPYDYHWMADFQNSRPSGKMVRWVLGILTFDFGLLALAAFFSPDTRHSPIALVWRALLLISVVVVSAAWFTRPFPGRRGVVAFAIFADVGSASAIVINPPAEALLTCAVFAVIGTFCTFFLSARWLLAHLMFAVTCTLVAAAVTYGSEEMHIATLIFRIMVVLLAISAVPLVSHLIVTMLTDDARTSLLDPLTGLLNRRGLGAAMDEVWISGRQAERCTAVLVVDIDGFKSINDEHGHVEGDAVIVRIADRLGSHLGEYGVLARTGGEEYLAVVSTSQLHIDTLIHGVRTAQCNPADTVAVTVSIGAAIVHWNSSLWDEDIDIVPRAIRVADSVMYKAKAAGGDRIVTTVL
ncbi:GGDEF domain-containing protein [Rhodococcus sp. IEGM 1330]|uniref:GGDEF domain-containing protein n=1 Tax=Rhodococcus sp. IEGM 1330 TaxID=3082225 RepID=UPI002953BAA9|nr:GGDEF domain-containing protein [Rhodococcus sp. IEGM 1330]MDV8021827.1 GGDEF domain-containing protein [Rhodococcus sp. IEGM 1330]